MTGIRKLLILLLLIAVGHTLQSQQLSLFTQYREHISLINPAAVESDFLGFGQNITFGASIRAQWVGLENAPITQTLRGAYLNPVGRGVSLMAGGHIINDQTGPTGFTGIYGRIAGVLSSDPEYSGFVVGLSGGFVQYRVKSSELFLREDNDLIGTTDQSEFYPDVGLGIFYYTTLDGGIFDNDYIYGGISMPQAFGLDLTFQGDNGEFFTQRIQHYYALVGLYKFFGDDSFLEPSVWVKYVENAPISADFNLRYQMPTSLWVGVGGSLSGTLHLEAGLRLGEDNSFKFGYGYDYSFSSFGPSAGGTHEVNLAYSIFQ